MQHNTILRYAFVILPPPPRGGGLFIATTDLIVSMHQIVAGKELKEVSILSISACVADPLILLASNLLVGHAIIFQVPMPKGIEALLYLAYYYKDCRDYDLATQFASKVSIS